MSTLFPQYGDNSFKDKMNYGQSENSFYLEDFYHIFDKYYHLK